MPSTVKVSIFVERDDEQYNSLKYLVYDFYHFSLVQNYRVYILYLSSNSLIGSRPNTITFCLLPNLTMGVGTIDHIHSLEISWFNPDASRNFILLQFSSAESFFLLRLITTS